MYRLLPYDRDFCFYFSPTEWFEKRKFLCPGIFRVKSEIFKPLTVKRRRRRRRASSKGTVAQNKLSPLLSEGTRHIYSHDRGYTDKDSLPEAANLLASFNRSNTEDRALDDLEGRILAGPFRQPVSTRRSPDASAIFLNALVYSH